MAGWRQRRGREKEKNRERLREKEEQGKMVVEKGELGFRKLGINSKHNLRENKAHTNNLLSKFFFIVYY